MTTDRFQFQRECVERALAGSLRPVLNVGCNSDPAGLKTLDPGRVINCDLFAHDETMGRPNVVDRLFDATQAPWPFLDRSTALVVFGDILEHLTPDEMRVALREARRVAARLCVSVPEDHRPETGDPEHVGRFPRGAVHQTTVTESLLRELLGEAGWTVTEWRHPLYDDGVFWGERTMGHFVACE